MFIHSLFDSTANNSQNTIGYIVVW